MLKITNLIGNGFSLQACLLAELSNIIDSY